MKVQGINASSRKTRELIKKAFAEEIEEKGELKRVSITTLVKKADITRGTFYSHYDNIYDVARDIQNETIDVLFSNIKNLTSINDVNEYFDNVMNYFNSNKEIYFMLLKSDDVLMFTERITRLMQKNIYDYLDNRNIENLSLNITFFIDGCINLIIRYFRKQIDASLDEICEYMKNTFVKIFS